MNKDMKLIHNVFSVFYAIPPGVTTWNLSEKELWKKWHTLLNSGLF
jgi:hypothetical protein